MYHCCIKLSLYCKEVMSKAYNKYALSKSRVRFVNGPGKFKWCQGAFQVR